MVDGIKPVPANKFSRMNMDLTKFINPNLTWKILKRGHRRTTRYPRKPAATRFKVGVKLSKNMHASSVFESEKFGVAVLGQRFAEKVVDVPIKKRKLLRRAPSSLPQTPLPKDDGVRSPRPQTLSPHHEESEQLVDSKLASGQLYCPYSLSKHQRAINSRGGVTNCKISQLSNKELCHSDDFSGIELLAAAACSSSFDDSADHVEGSSVVEELATPEGIDSSTAAVKDTIAKIEPDTLSVQGSAFPALQNHPNNENSVEVKEPAPSKNVRLHWDLNTVMDEWDEPCYDPPVNSQTNYLEGVYVNGLPSENLKLDGSETRDFGDGDGESVSMVDSLACSIASAGVRGNQLLSNSESTVVLQDGEDCCRTSSLELGTLASDSLQFEKRDVTCDIQGHVRISEMSDSSGSRTKREVTGTVPSKTSDTESSSSKSDIVDSSPHPPKHEESTSTKSILRGQTVVNGESNNRHDSPVHFASKPLSKCDGQPLSEVAQGGFQSLKLCKSEGDHKLATEDSLSDCCGSNDSQDEQGHMVGGNTLTKVQAGYDSPFEDGELREPNVYVWEENEVEDREIECVDYGSDDNIYEDDFDSIEFSISEKKDASRVNSQTVEDGTSLVEKDVPEKFGIIGKRSLDTVPSNTGELCAVGDTSKKPSCLLSLNSSGGYQLHDHSEDVIVDGNDDGSRKFQSENKNVNDESRASRGNLLRIEGSSSFDVHRRGAAYVQQSRFDNNGSSYSRAERNFGSEKFMGRERLPYQGHGRNESGGQWVDSSMKVWDSRNGQGYPRPRNVVGDSSVRSDGSNSHVYNQSRNHAPRGMYRTPNRRLSPTGRNASYGTNSGAPPVRAFSRDRCRGGSGFHPQGGFRRDTQEEYHDSGPCYLERKERCFSPNLDRGAHLSRPRRRSRSRSRTRSPTAWHLQRERNVNSRRGSPDYRPYQGERFPFQKPSFAGDAEGGGFVSPTRGHLSPQRNSRVFVDRSCTDEQFRDRRSSPVRMFKRSQRFDPPSGYPGRVKSDEYFRPMTRPGRYPITGAGRECKYEDSNDNRRKHDDRYEMMNRVRRFGGGGVKRFKYAVDDSFEARNSPTEDNCYREERGVSRYNNDRIFATAALSSGNFDEDDSKREG